MFNCDLGNFGLEGSKSNRLLDGKVVELNFQEKSVLFETFFINTREKANSKKPACS